MAVEHQAAKKAAQKCRGKHAFIHVYCICGLPESYDTHMIEFEQYQKCFHFKWMKLVTEPDSYSLVPRPSIT